MLITNDAIAKLLKLILSRLLLMAKESIRSMRLDYGREEM